MVNELHYKIILLALLIAMTALTGLAQDINKPEVVTGVVLADEEPVIGATVRLKGTDIGAATDYDGRFRLKAPVGSTLEIQYIGMETVEVKVDGKPLVIRMVPPKFWCAWVCNFGYCGKVPEGLFGRVYDSNAHVLSGAIVTVSPSCLSTTTDDKGDFSIQVAEGDTILRVEHPGYEPRQGKIAGNEFVISLDPSPVNKQASIEQFDSLSYAMGDYFMRIVLDSQDKKTQQIKSDREEYIRGFSDGLNLYRQERTAANSYYDGQQMGLFFLMSINFEQIEEKDQPHLDCLIEGLRKVADNTVVLPQDTIGAHHLLLDFDDETMLSMVYGDSCRIETTMGILLGLRDYDTLPPIDRDQGDSISIKDQQAFARGMADVLESSNSEATYDMGRFAALFYFIDNMRMKQLLGLDFDYDAIIDGARGALELTERKMSVEEVELCLTQYYAAQYNIQAAEGLDYNDDIDDALLEEAARAAIEDVSREMAKNPNILQRYSLSGQVSVKGGKGKKSPAIGWTVTLDDGFMTTVTNQNGEYRFDDVPPGNYTIFYQDPFALARVFQVTLKNKDKKLDQTFNEDGSDYVSQAKRDIFMGRLQFQVISGDTPVYYTGEYCFDSFYERYGVQIVDWGDIIPCEPVVFANYNKQIFDYLDKTFGDEWRSEEWLPILRTVEGFNQWHP